MASREELHNKLIELLGNNHVYYQAPENLKMEYPAIRYSKSDIIGRKADNMNYSSINCYEIIVLDIIPDNDVIQKILSLPLSSFERHYVSDNLNHDVIRLYY